MNPALAPSIRELSFVDFVEPDIGGSVGQSSQDTSWGVKKVGADWVWSNTGVAGQQVAITMLDQGLDSIHRVNQSKDGPENVFVDCRYSEEVANTCYQPSGFPHGSAVAGVISARDNSVGYIGIAHNPANFASVRVCDSEGDCPWSALIDGIDWATSTEYGHHIVNISIQGCEGSTLLAGAIANAVEAGLLLVSIAGNTDFDECEGNPTGVLYPGKYDEVLTVSGTGTTDQFAAPNMSPCVGGSRYGQEVDLSAPFYAATMTENGSWATFCGTSFAAPVVAAVAALVWTGNPALDAAGVRTLLEAYAVDLGGAGKDSYFGWGRVSATNIFNPQSGGLTVMINGVDVVPSQTTCTWTVGASGGESPYFFTWLVDGISRQEGGDSFSWSSSSPFLIWVNAIDSEGQVAGGAGKSITIGGSGCLDQ